MTPEQVQKAIVSFEPELRQDCERVAREAGVSLETWVAQTLDAAHERMAWDAIDEIVDECVLSGDLIPMGDGQHYRWRDGYTPAPPAQ